MGILLTVRGDDTVVASVDFSPSDLERLAKASADRFEVPLGVLLGDNEGWSRRTKADFVIAVDRILTAIEDLRPSLGYQYMTRIKYPGMDRWDESSGGISGTLTDGRLYSLNCGIGFCTIQWMKQHPDGTGEVIATQDAREMEKIEAESLGTISIIKKKRAFSVERELKKLRKRMDEVPDDAVLSVCTG